MPRYTFTYSDLHPGFEPIMAELAGDETARAEAVTAAGEMLRDIGSRFWRSPDWALVVTDEASTVVCRVRILGTTGSG